MRLRATGNVDISQLNNGDTLDGIAVATGDEVLLDQQSTASQDGIYTVGATAGSTVRSVELPSGASASPLAVTVEEGSTHGDKVFIQTADPAIVGTDGLTFSVLGGGTTYTADESTLTLVGSQFSVKAGGITPTQLSFDPATQTELDAHLNDTADAHDASAISFSATGTIAATDVQAAIAELGTEKADTFSTGTHASSTSVAVTHSLGKQFVCAHVFITSTGEEIFPDVTATSTTVTTFTFANAPSANTLTFRICA